MAENQLHPLGLINGLLCLVKQGTLPRQPSSLGSACILSQDPISFSFLPPIPRSCGCWSTKARSDPLDFPLACSHSSLGVLVIIGQQKGVHQYENPIREGFYLFSSLLGNAWHTAGPQYFLNEWQHCFLYSIQLDIFIYWVDYSCTLFFLGGGGHFIQSL